MGVAEMALEIIVCSFYLVEVVRYAPRDLALIVAMHCPVILLEGRG
jgi:hypothetical protein